MRAALTSIACSSSLGTNRNHVVRGGRSGSFPNESSDSGVYRGMTEPIYAADRFARVGVDPPTDRARFEQMLDRHHRRLRKVVAGVIADPNRVDDVLQEAYYNAYRKLPRAFANEAHESTWFYRVVYRCCLNELRSRRRRPEAAVGEVE